MKKLLLIVVAVLLFVSPASAEMITYWFSGYYGSLGSTLEYSLVSGSDDWNTSEGIRKTLIPVNGTGSDLYAELLTLTANADIVFTVMKNSMSSSLVATMTSGNDSCSDTTHEVDVSRGDFLSMAGINPGTSRVPRWSMKFTADNDNEGFLSVTSEDSPAVGGTEYLPVWGTHTWSGSSSTFNQTVSPIPFTAEKVMIVLTNPPTTGAVVLTLMEGGVATGYSFTLTGSEISHSNVVSVEAVSAYETLNWRCELGTSAANNIGPVYIAFVTNTGTNGESLVCGGTSNDLASGAQEANYVHANNGQWGSSMNDPLMAFDTTIKNLYAYSTTDPGGSEQILVDIQADQVTTGLSCPVVGGTQSCTNINPFDVTAGENLRIEYTASSSASVGDLLWSLVQYNEPAAGGGGASSQVIINAW